MICCLKKNYEINMKTVDKLLILNDCLYSHVDVEVILQDEPAEHEEEPHVSFAALNK